MVDAALTSASGELFDRAFTPDEISLIRHQVAALVARAGLVGERLDGFVLAVNEIVTNVALHAGGHGRIRLHVTPRAVGCTVADSGPGIPAELIAPSAPPGVLDAGGRGIWLAHQLCDSVTISTGPAGTTVELRTALPRRSEQGWGAVRSVENGRESPGAPPTGG